MRKWILLAVMTAGIFSMASLTPNRAEAMAIGAPAGLSAAIEESTLAQDIAYVCRRVWRCGDFGCGWRRSCWWTGPRYYRSYGWRHRHWRRW